MSHRDNNQQRYLGNTAPFPDRQRAEITRGGRVLARLVKGDHETAEDFQRRARSLAGVYRGEVRDED